MLCNHSKNKNLLGGWPRTAVGGWVQNCGLELRSFDFSMQNLKETRQKICESMFK